VIFIYFEYILVIRAFTYYVCGSICCRIME